MNELSCPKCKVGTVQRSTIYIEGERYNAFGCNKCDYGYWELFVDAKTYTVSTEGTADQFAKDISEMSDEKGIKTNEVDKMIEARAKARNDCIDHTSNWRERALKAEGKLAEIKNSCQKELDNITEKPSSQVDPYTYGYLSGVERVADWILDDFFSIDDEKESK